MGYVKSPLMKCFRMFQTILQQPLGGSFWLFILFLKDIFPFSKAYQHILKASPLWLALCFFSSCLNLPRGSGISVELKGEQVFKKGKQFGNLKVGGLSELFYDPASHSFLALSDDKKNHRFYRLVLKHDLSSKKPYKLEIKEQVFLKSPGHKRLKRNMDPEALVLYKDQILIASEGQQIYKIHEPTQIFTFDKQAVLKSAWPVPLVFWNKKLTKRDPIGFWNKALTKQEPLISFLSQMENFGQQENKGFESLTLDLKLGHLWTATEKPLKQDIVFKRKFFVRLSAFDIQTKKMFLQYPYFLEDEDAGLVALRFLKPNVFLGLERAYKKIKKRGVNEVNLFLIDCHQAGNIQPYPANLPGKLKPCSKKRLWTSSKADIAVDNLEALALGPLIPFSTSKKQLLVLASDNNFNEEKQKTQFLFFHLNFSDNF